MSRKVSIMINGEPFDENHHNGKQYKAIRSAVESAVKGSFLKDDLVRKPYITGYQPKYDNKNSTPPNSGSSVSVRTDPVNHPSHYTHGRFEVIDIIEDATSGLSGIDAVCVANVIKYVCRHQYKNGIEDLRKAQWYLDRLIKHMDNKC